MCNQRESEEVFVKTVIKKGKNFARRVACHYLAADSRLHKTPVAGKSSVQRSAGQTSSLVGGW